MASFFDESNRLSYDKCAVATEALQNKSVLDYVTWNMYSTSTCKEEDIRDFTLKNVNLRYKDGFGNVSGCTVDTDSELRNNARLTNVREKEQLCTRWDQGVPNYGKGGLIPNIESRLKFAEDTHDLKCDIVAEKNFDRFIPLLCDLKTNIQNPDHLILPFERGGKITRDYVQNDSYLEKCGFFNDGRTWRRKNF